MSQQLQSALSKFAGVSLAIGVGGSLLSESLYNVDGGHTAVIWHRFQGGVQPYVLGEGTHFRAWGKRGGGGWGGRVTGRTLEAAAPACPRDFPHSACLTPLPRRAAARRHRARHFLPLNPQASPW